MGVEEEFEEVVEGPEAETIHERILARRRRLQQELTATTDSFLGNVPKVEVPVIVPSYYGELLTWALHCYIEAEGWKIVKTLGYHGPEPVYIDVSTGCGECHNLLRDGLLFLKRGKDRLVVTIDANLRTYNSMVVNGPARSGKKVRAFAEGVWDIATEQNFYRGGKLEFSGRLRFLNLPAKTWDSIVLDEAIKDEIRANTTGFLANRERLAVYGIPAKRGVLLAGEPGTGKTLICKALMAEAPNITCIVASAYALDEDEYITDLYRLAHDLSPCIVFIEDIDLIAHNRMESGYSRGPALLSLLAVLDGVEECQQIVTVATTNHLEILDKAVGQRPSRFDRVIRLTRPSLEQRKELVSSLCQRIPLGESVQAYIARRAEHCTPAQLQEIVYSLVIEHPDELSSARSPYLDFSTEDIDGVISEVKGRNGRPLGFDIRSNHNGSKCDQIGAIELSQRLEGGD